MTDMPIPIGPLSDRQLATVSHCIFTVIVFTDTAEHAQKVMTNRLDFDADYGFDYGIALDAAFEDHTTTTSEGN